MTHEKKKTWKDRFYQGPEPAQDHQSVQVVSSPERHRRDIEESQPTRSPGSHSDRELETQDGTLSIFSLKSYLKWPKLITHIELFTFFKTKFPPIIYLFFN